MTGAQDIRFERHGTAGLVTLDRPRALNAVSHDMVRRLAAQLQRWRDDCAVTRVIVTAAGGRAFLLSEKPTPEDIQKVFAEDAGVHPDHLAPLALRFCFSHPAVSSVIPGMRRVVSVENNSAAAGQGPLPPHLLEVLRRHAWDRNFYPA